MRRGKQIRILEMQELALLKPIDQRGLNKERALLILHGFSSSPAVYRELIPKINYYDALVCPVLPGHSESIDCFSKATARQWLTCVEENCAQLCAEYKQVDVMGLSLGGLLASSLSRNFNINHLFLLAPAIKLNLHIKRSIMLAQTLHCLGFKHLRSNAGDLKSNEQAEIAYRKLPITTIIEMLRFANQYQWIAPKCPVDLFLGKYDHVVNSKEIEQLFVSLPNTKIHWLEHSAHVLPLDNDLEEIVSCINRSKNFVTQNTSTAISPSS